MSANAYAQATGAAVQATKPTARPLPPLTEAERVRVAKNYAQVKTHLPELIPLIKELHEAGLIDGLRSIRRVELIQKGKES